MSTDFSDARSTRTRTEPKTRFEQNLDVLLGITAAVIVFGLLVVFGAIVHYYHATSEAKANMSWGFHELMWSGFAGAVLAGMKFDCMRFRGAFRH